MPPASNTRRLSTSEARREAVLEAAEKGFADRGLYGTPTLEIARAAGISHAYLFRLFPTKTDLFVALVERNYARVRETFARAAREAHEAGADVIPAMGASYHELLADRELLLVQMHAQSACGIPEVRDAVRAGTASLVELIESESGADAEIVRNFFAHGMLVNVLAAIGADGVDDHWAKVLFPAE